MSVWITFYPIVATIAAINKPLKNELTHWCIWWVMYQCTHLMNYAVWWAVWWIPFIETIENTMLFALYSGMVTTYIRNNWILLLTKSINKQWPVIKMYYTKLKKLIYNVIINLVLPNEE